MMMSFADRLLEAVKTKGTPCIVGLDPRLDQIPDFITACRHTMPRGEAITSSIVRFHEIVLDKVGDLVPAVKLQVAFYERYGLPGLAALEQTIKAAKERGLLVIADAKRNDIASTAEAYADEILGNHLHFRQTIPDLRCQLPHSLSVLGARQLGTIYRSLPSLWERHLCFGKDIESWICGYSR